MAFVVGLGVLEDEAAGTLQAVRTLFHTVGAIFEVEALYAVLGALQEEKTRQVFFICQTRREVCGDGCGACKWYAHTLSTGRVPFQKHLTADCYGDCF